MSRSQRKNPFVAFTTAQSEKRDKLASHRVYRRTLKQLITPTLETPLPTERQLTDPWKMAKRGKRYFPMAMSFGFLRK